MSDKQYPSNLYLESAATNLDFAKRVSSEAVAVMAKELLALRKAFSEPAAYVTYKGYLLHAGDPKLSEYSEPTPLFMKPSLPN